MQRMRFMRKIRPLRPIQSLGGKLVAGAALLLLLCMLLFLLGSWLLMTIYSDREAKNSANVHLTLAKWAYTEHNTLLIQEFQALATDKDVLTATSSHRGQTLLNILRDTSMMLTARYRFSFSHISVVLPNHQFLAQLSYEGAAYTGLISTTRQLVDQGLQGNIEEAFQQDTDASQVGQLGQLGQLPINGALWELRIAIPIVRAGSAPIGVLLLSQPIDDTFAAELAEQSGANVLLCLSGHVQGIAGTGIRNVTQRLLPATTCQPKTQSIDTSTEGYFALTSSVHTAYQLASSPTLIMIDVEPPATLNLRNHQLFLLFAGLSIFLFAFGTFLFALLARMFFIHPLQDIQAQARRIVTEDTGVVLPSQDELQTLTSSFRLLSQSLESESKAMTEQLGNVLIMSDALISTLNLEQLLGEIVARLGRIMQAKHISLLLYGREMLAPWAVAQWSSPLSSAQPTSAELSSSPSVAHTGTISIPQQRGAVTVHADPNSDVTMAATTKMMAIPPSVSGKRRTVGTSSTTHSAQSPHILQHTPSPSGQLTYGLRRPRIPRVALRNLDMILARMVIQRRKIAYAEDVKQIYQERQETWSRLAVEAGYGSVIAVPLLSQEQAIGAIMLYSDKPSQVSSRDTFLLSTAAIQASMAIQNALLFAEIKEKNAELERANSLKSQFLANVTHELRSPLHSIIGYGSMIVDGFVEGELTPQQEKDIRFIVTRAEDLSNLVDDMLDLSKIEADHIEITLEPVDLTQCMTDIVNQYKLTANEKKLSLTVDIEEDLPHILADSRRLKQIVTNLVSNALKFTQTGGVSIRCALTRDGDMVRIAVQDTGIGISPAALGLIFEAFRQADGSTTRQFGGTGLGLTIAKRLIELQGGEIAVESVVGQGSVFSLILPIAPLSLVTSTS